MTIRKTTDRLLAGTILAGASMMGLAGPALAQDSSGEDEIVVTGSRIVRQDYVANSPITTVTAEQIVANADVTLETFLNSLPQISPAGTTSSNNPSNNGRASIDLRGLGSNRTIVLIDGRRAMVSDSSLTVDLNAIPAAMIDNIEVITGGAGAAYGADAIAGAVNIRLKNDFEGADLRVSYSNQEELWDAEEYNVSAVIGGNFADGRGNAIIGFDRSFRQPLTKAQRPFSANATSTTGTPPEGAILWTSSNEVTLAGVQSVFAGYGVAGSAVTNASGRIGFNRDGTLIFYGQPGATFDVQNFRDPITVNQNARFFPDFYSYNFDAPNALVLPLDRYSYMGNINYETDSGIEFFGNVNWTEYTSDTLLAPTPLPSVQTRRTGENSNVQVGSSLIEAGQTLAGALVVPVTNPFLSTDARNLLASRAGDDPILAGSGGTEAFRYVFRPLGFGPRRSLFENTIVQFTGGVRGDIADTGWDYEAYISEGRTEIDITQFGNIDTQRLTDVLANPASGGGACSTWNPFGNNPLPAACQQYLESPVSRRQKFTQQIGQAFVRGPIAELSAGEIQTVFGVEYRAFEYSDRFLSAAGPFSGFNVGQPDLGKNEFFDVFGEVYIPLVSGAPLAQQLDVTLGFRSSTFNFTRFLPTFAEAPEQSSEAYKIDVNWEPLDWARLRGGFQRSVRAPNFAELFSSSSSFPQIFDPCSVSSRIRQGANASQVAALCVATGIPAGQIATYAATPGGQALITTAGNPNLTPETADTFTVGLVFQSPIENQWLERLRGSIDYYNIEVTDAIIAANVNVGIADCYNYYGNNPTYTLAGNAFCQGLVRNGGTIANINRVGTIPNVAANQFPGLNGGEIITSGIDFQLEYGFDWAWLGLPDALGSVRSNVVLTHLLEFQQRDRAGLPMLEYAGSITVFGAGLGTSYPEWRANVGLGWDIGDLTLETRGRYIGEMINRFSVIYPGETNFGGGRSNVDSVWYWDVAGTWNVTDNASLRLGVNNVNDEPPQLYSPNAQSGTDPSSYDVIGRRVFASVNLRF